LLIPRFSEAKMKRMSAIMKRIRKNKAKAKKRENEDLCKNSATKNMSKK